MSLSLLLAAACGGPSRPSGDAAARTPDLSLADAARVAPGDEGDFTGLPGVEGFESLAPELQERVVERANRTRCDCGCLRHSVNHCLHQDHDCEVAMRLARGFIDDARSWELQSGEAAPAAPEQETESEPAEPGGTNEPAGGDAL